eukprot:2273816-Rhodomonas_salina.1
MDGAGVLHSAPAPRVGGADAAVARCCWLTVIVAPVADAGRRVVAAHRSQRVHVAWRYVLSSKAIVVGRAVGTAGRIQSIVPRPACAVLHMPRVRPHVLVWACIRTRLGTFGPLCNGKVDLRKALIAEAV